MLPVSKKAHAVHATAPSDARAGSADLREAMGQVQLGSSLTIPCEEI